MLRYVCFVACLIFNVDLGMSLMCYTCTSTNYRSCSQATNRQVTQCGRAVRGFRSLCSYTESYDFYRRAYQEQAGCQLVSGSESMAAIEKKFCSKPNRSVTKCKLCVTDYCNGAY